MTGLAVVAFFLLVTYVLDMRGDVKKLHARVWELEKRVSILDDEVEDLQEPLPEEPGPEE